MNGPKKLGLVILIWVRSSIFTTRKRSCGKVIFSQVSLILFTGCPHVMTTHDALGHGYPLDTRHGTYPPPLPLPSLLLPTSDGHHRGPVQTCSLKDLPPWFWHLVVAIKTHTVGKQTVRILLECCLVISIVKPSIFEYLLCLIYVIRHAQKVSYNNN